MGQQGKAVYACILWGVMVFVTMAQHFADRSWYDNGYEVCVEKPTPSYTYWSHLKSACFVDRLLTDEEMRDMANLLDPDTDHSDWYTRDDVVVPPPSGSAPTPIEVTGDVFGPPEAGIDE